MWDPLLVYFTLLYFRQTREPRQTDTPANAAPGSSRALSLGILLAGLLSVSILLIFVRARFVRARRARAHRAMLAEQEMGPPQHDV